MKFTTESLRLPDVKFVIIDRYNEEHRGGELILNKLAIELNGEIEDKPIIALPDDINSPLHSDKMRSVAQIGMDGISLEQQRTAEARRVIKREAEEGHNYDVPTS